MYVYSFSNQSYINCLDTTSATLDFSETNPMLHNCSKLWQRCASFPHSPSLHLSARIHQENQWNFNYRKPVDEGVWDRWSVEMPWYGTWTLPINPNKQKGIKILCCLSYMHIWKAASSPLHQHELKTITILKIKESEPNI